MMAWNIQAMTGDGHDREFCGRGTVREHSFSSDKFQYPKKLAEFNITLGRSLLRACGHFVSIA